MRRYFVQFLFLFCALAAYSEDFDIIQVTVYQDENDEEGVTDSICGVAHYDNDALSMTFGNFTAYNFIVNTTKKGPEITTLNATDLVNGNTTDVEILKTDDGMNVMFDTPSDRSYVFVLVKRNKQ